MGTFNAKILAEFQPPRKWKLGRELSYSTTDLDSDDIAALQDIGLDLKRDTNISPAVFTVPTEFMTDLASTPRALWAFVAPFDVARAAVIHDILYEKINMGFESEAIHKRSPYRRIADKVFLEGMKSAFPNQPKWKIYACFWAVRMFGRWAIKKSKPRGSSSFWI